MAETVRHGFPLISAGQAQKEITHNESISLIDAKLNISVLSRQVQNPPSSPDIGDSYIVPNLTTGDWLAREGKIATFDGYGWNFHEPITGTAVWIVDEKGSSIWDDGWSNGWPVKSIQIGERNIFSAPIVRVLSPDGGELIDIEARNALVQIINALSDQGLILK